MMKLSYKGFKIILINMLKDLVEKGDNMYEYMYKYNQMWEFQLTYESYKKESNKNVKNNKNHGKK